MPLDEKTDEALQISGQSLEALAERGMVAISGDKLDEAATIYDLIQQMSHSVAVALRIAASNRLKEEVLPEDMLEVRYNGAEQPMGNESPGNYL